MSLFERVVNAPFNAIDQTFDAVFGEVQSKGTRRRRRPVDVVFVAQPVCERCDDAGVLAIKDASGAYVAVPCSCRGGKI